MEIKPIYYKNVYDKNMNKHLEAFPSRNRHSFTMVSNGYRLVFNEEKVEWKNQPYYMRFSLVSYDENDNYAYFGIGKKEQNSASSFQDAVEKEMLELAMKKADIQEEIAKLQQKLDAINEFSEALPKIMLEDGYDKKG